MGTVQKDLLAALSTLAAALAAGLVIAGPRWRRSLGVPLGGLALVPCWWVAPLFPRAVLALVGCLVVLRAVDLLRERRDLPARARLWHVSSPVDTTTLRKAPRSFDVAAFSTGLAWACVSGGSVWVAWSFRDARLVRWSVGVLAVYALVEALWRTVRGVYRLLGFETPPLHEHPIASRSIGELWGARWTRPVSRWVDRNALRPLARRGHPLAGLMAAFLASGLIHGYAILACGQPFFAAVMVGYFGLQGLLVLVERVLGVARWPAAAAHAWMLGLMLVTSPLFVEPCARAVGFAGAAGP